MTGPASLILAQERLIVVFLQTPPPTFLLDGTFDPNRPLPEWDRRLVRSGSKPNSVAISTGSRKALVMTDDGSEFRRGPATEVVGAESSGHRFKKSIWRARPPTAQRIR